jgi:uncharacterized protein (DUF697 family)
MNQTQREACARIIHTAAVTASVAASHIGPGSDTFSLIPIHIGMILSLAKVFHKDLSKDAAKGMAVSLISAYGSRSVSQTLLGWIPGLGSLLGAGLASQQLTTEVGWLIARRFEREVHVDPEVMRHLEETFGHEAGLDWLKTECAPLGNFRPIDLLDTENGRRQVLDVINCIDNGYVY